MKCRHCINKTQEIDKYGDPLCGFHAKERINKEASDEGHSDIHEYEHIKEA